MKGFLNFVEFLIRDFVGVGFAGFEEAEDSFVGDFGEFGLEDREEGRDAFGDFLF